MLLLSAVLLWCSCPAAIHTLPNTCRSLEVVESIPDNLTYHDSAVQNTATTTALLQLLELSSSSLDVAEFYFTLRPDPPPGDGSDEDGRKIYAGLHSTGLSLNASGGALRIVQNVPNKEFPDTDSIQLAKDGAAVLRYIDFNKLIGGGIIHTKLWVSDRKHFYLGSANMDWQSLRQVKELGVLGIDCPIIAEDLQKLFEVYWYLTTNPVPDKFPVSLNTVYNNENHMEFTVSEDNSTMNTYVVSSPPQFCTAGRTGGIDGLLGVLNAAQEYIYIEVMDYFPAIIYTYPNKYWPVIDNALRSAIFDRGVELRLLVGLMPHNRTRSDEYYYLESLAALDGSGSRGRVRSKVKVFIIPAYTPAQAKLQYARVNHAKFVVTDKHSYVSTSNWSGDYFTSTGGISLIMSNTGSCNVCMDMRMVFERDWSSEHTRPLAPWSNNVDVF